MRAAFYLRVSTTDQRCENQLCDLQQLAQQRGWNVVREYRDHGFSGARARRPALDQLLSDAAAATLMWSRCGRRIAWHAR
jgi:DNA invertase Pin-like site-specific DNA recombinase